MYQINVKIKNQFHQIEMDPSEIEEYGSLKELTHNLIYWFMRMEGFWNDTVEEYYVQDAQGKTIAF
jgi:hypothetical protein